MDDSLKTFVFGFLGLIVIHGSLEKRARRDAARTAEEAFQHSGVIHARIEPRGMFGVFASRLYSIDIDGEGLKSDRLPFVAVPRSGWKGQIRHLRLHFGHLTLNGLPVERFEADIPDVTYDIGRALYRDKLVIRGAGEGPASVRIDAAGLRAFIDRKYSRILSEVEVAFQDNRVAITGKLLVFGAPTPFLATGELEPRTGRYIDLVKPTIEMNGRPLSETAASNLLKQINPVLDISTDLGLEGYFTLSSVSIGDKAITVFGRAAIPIRRGLDMPGATEDVNHD